VFTGPTFQILGTLHISETVRARNFKFYMHIDYKEFLQRKIKNKVKGGHKGSRNLLL